MNNEMTEKDWNEVDYSSRQIIKKFLQYIKATEITDSKGNCCWDVCCKLNNKRVSIEIKDRNLTSYRFGDIMIEQIKKDCNDRRIDNAEFDACLVINVFTDNVIAIANLNDSDVVYAKRWCDETTKIKGGSKQKILKDVILYPQRRKIKFENNEGRFKFSRV